MTCVRGLTVIIFHVSRAYEELSKSCDQKKEDFAKFEQQDVRCREDLKHAKSKSKKLEKMVEQEKKKVMSVWRFWQYKSTYAKEITASHGVLNIWMGMWLAKLKTKINSQH